MRHAATRVTLDTYTQAITEQERKAQSAVVQLTGESERFNRRLMGTGCAQLCPFVPTKIRLTHSKLLI
jgi:hypothetical protein